MISGIFSSSTHREFLDWREPISCVHSVMLVFATKLCDLYSPLLPLSPSLWFTNKYIYVCTRGRGGAQSDKCCRKVPFQVTFQMTTFCIVFYESCREMTVRRGKDRNRMGNDELQSIVGRWQICRTQIFQICMCGIWPKISFLFQGLDLKFWVLPGEFGTGLYKGWPYWKWKVLSKMKRYNTGTAFTFVTHNLLRKYIWLCDWRFNFYQGHM